MVQQLPTRWDRAVETGAEIPREEVPLAGEVLLPCHGLVVAGDKDSSAGAACSSLTMLEWCARHAKWLRDVVSSLHGGFRLISGPRIASDKWVSPPRTSMLSPTSLAQLVLGSPHLASGDVDLAFYLFDILVARAVLAGIKSEEKCFVASDLIGRCLWLCFCFTHTDVCRRRDVSPPLAS